MDTSFIGLAGTILGMTGVIYSFVSVSKNSAKWTGIVEQKMNTVIDNLNKVENRLAKLEDDRASVWRELAELKSVQLAQERSVERAHTRLDRLSGGKERDTP